MGPSRERYRRGISIISDNGRARSQFDRVQNILGAEARAPEKHRGSWLAYRHEREGNMLDARKAPTESSVSQPDRPGLGQNMSWPVGP